MWDELELIEYTTAQRESFRGGELRDRWFAEYRGVLFDDNDIKRARNQPNRHFVEWLAAVELHRRHGYHCLLQKYRRFNAPNRSKRERLLALVGAVPGLLDLIDGTSTEPPDLFLYRPDVPDDWRFCEVKGPKDSLRAVQQSYFSQLAKLTAKPIALARFREVD